MSVIQSIKQVLGLSGTASENHFWDGSVANQLSLKRGTPDAPEAEVMSVVNGKVTVLVSPFVPIAVGTVAGGGALIIGAGFASSVRTGTGIYDVTFSTPVENTNYTIQATSDASTTGIIAAPLASQCTTAKVQIRTYDAAGVLTDAQFNVCVWKI